MVLHVYEPEKIPIVGHVSACVRMCMCMVCLCVCVREYREHGATEPHEYMCASINVIRSLCLM